MSRLPMIFSALAVLLGIAAILAFKENRHIRLGFYACMMLSGVSKTVVTLRDGAGVRLIDILVALVFGVASFLQYRLIVRSEA